MLGITAFPVVVTGPTTIVCNHFLGADVRAGTLTVDHGAAVAAGKRIGSFAATDEPSWCSFPVEVCDVDGGPQQKQRIHCAGATDATVYVSGYVSHS